MKLIYLKSALKSDSFDVSIGIKIPFFRVSVTVEPGCSLLTVRYHELFDTLITFYLSSLVAGSTIMSDSSSSSEKDIEYLSGEERRKRKGEEKRSFPRKKAQRKKAKFRHSWLNVPEFKGWLAKDKSSDEKAFCSHCSQSLCCGKSELRKYAKSAKHSESVRKLEAPRKLTTRIDHVFTTDKNEEESLKAKLAAFIVENNLPLSFVETLVPFLKSLPHKAVVEKIRLGKL
jgi:hypothetical protein